MKLKSTALATSALALLCVAPTVTFAQFDRPPFGEPDRKDRERGRENENRDRGPPERREREENRGRERFEERDRHDNRPVVRQRFARGERLPDQFRQNRYFVEDWRERRLSPPPRGFRWVRNDDFDYFLVALDTGLIAESMYRDAYADRWQQRYAREFTYNDDLYYQQCRTNPDPAGVIAGALIGGLLGNAIGRGPGETGATVAGVIVGGAVGASLTGRLDCEDRSFAYRTYYDGFNSGRPHVAYQWRNPRTGHYGEFRVEDYYYDPVGFRCANYTQQIFIQGRPEIARGHACQQPDGNWTIVS